MSDQLGIRLEPSFVAASLEPGLAARTHDPAWYIAVQWMLGEFDGDDAGTPIRSIANGVRDQVSKAQADTHVAAFDPLAVALEAHVIGGTARPPLDWTVVERLNAGNALARLLVDGSRTAALDRLLVRCAFTPAGMARIRNPTPDAALVSLLSNRALDGGQVFDAWKVDATALGLAQDTVIDGCFAAWVQWLRASGLDTGGRLPGAWRPESLDYKFQLETNSGLAFAATDHRTESIDWMSLDQAAPDPAALSRVSYASIPTPLRFRGMPNARYWELEEAEVDLGGIEPAPGDLVRLALAEISLVYGSDVVVLPIRERIGTVLKIDTVEIIDTFGQVSTLEHATAAAERRGQTWAFCAPLSEVARPSRWQLLLPKAHQPLSGPWLEQITLRRDEITNLVWAVENVVENAMGRPEPRLDREKMTLSSPGPVSNDLKYRIMEGGQPLWFPMPLQDTQPSETRLLELQRLAGSSAVPLGTLLPTLGGSILEREVPVEGLSVGRRWMLARSTMGVTLVWESRVRFSGDHQALPRVNFDVLNS